MAKNTTLLIREYRDWTRRVHAKREKETFLQQLLENLIKEMFSKEKKRKQKEEGWKERENLD